MSHHKDTYWVFSMNWFESYKKSPIKESIYYHKVMWPFEFSRSKQWQFSQRMVSLSKELAHFKKHGAVIFWELWPHSEHRCVSLRARYRHSERSSVTIKKVRTSLRARYCHSERGPVTPSAVQSLRPRSEWGPTYFRWKRNECRFSEKWSVLANVWFIETERGTAVEPLCWHPVPFIKY